MSFVAREFCARNIHRRNLICSRYRAHQTKLKVVIIQAPRLSRRPHLRRTCGEHFAPRIVLGLQLSALTATYLRG